MSVFLSTSAVSTLAPTSVYKHGLRFFRERSQQCEAVRPDFRNGFASGSGHGSIQFVLRHEWFPLSTEKRKAPTACC